MAIARQHFGKHIPEVTQSTVEGPPLLGTKLLGMFHSNRKTDNNRGTVSDDILYSVYLEVITGGHNSFENSFVEFDSFIDS
jgi:hypothetical protein